MTTLKWAARACAAEARVMEVTPSMGGAAYMWLHAPEAIV
jgi:hypothetical protein